MHNWCGGANRGLSGLDIQNENIHSKFDMSMFRIYVIHK